MSIAPNVPDLHLVEHSLLEGKWRPDIPTELAQTPECLLIQDVLAGRFKAVLTSPLVAPLLTLKDPPIVSTDGLLHHDLEPACRRSQPPGSTAEELLRLAVGVAFLHAFVQVNWTGPDLECTPASVLKLHNKNLSELSESVLHNQAISQLAYGGEPAYHLAKYPTFLTIAQQIFDLQYQQLTTSAWWKFRAFLVHQQILDDPVASDPAVFASLNDLDERLKVGSEVDLEGRMILERGLLRHTFAHDKIAAEEFVKAAKVMGLKYELSGAMGKRTKFQVSDLSQLVVLAESRKRAGEEDNATGGGAQRDGEANQVPETLALNDDTLLEQTEFTSTVDHTVSATLFHLDPANQPALHPLDQCILLGLCLNVKNTSPSHGLTGEQMQPYIARVISHPRNWSIHTMALLLRSRLESHRTRTVERATLQLQALIEQMPTSDSTVTERLLYFHDISLPSKWEMEKELAVRFLSLGVIRSAMEIFERLEMWEEVVKCWQALERPDKGIAIVTELLEGSREEAELVTSKGKASISEKQRPVMDVARTAKLWCLLGDLQPEKASENYQKAWEISGEKSGRAMRSLGGHFFAKGKYVEAIPCLQKAAAINPLLSRTWFILGCALVHEEDWQKARDAFTRCVAIDDEDGESWSNLASVYLRMGATEEKSQDRDVLIEDGDSGPPRKVPYASRMLAFRALKHGLKYSYSNWRMWSNYMIVAIDIGENSEACHALTRVIEERADKDGEGCVDFDVLDHLVDAVTRADNAKADEDVGNSDPQSLAQYNPNTGNRLAPRVAGLFTHTLLPRFSASPRMFRAYARFLVWRSEWAAALEAYMNAYRASVVGDESVATDAKRWNEAALELEELVDILRNLGPRATEAAEETRGGNPATGAVKRPRGTTWQFQARGLVRTFIGRTKDVFGDEPEWAKLERLLDELKRQ
ncbi:hypothetical protein FRB97_009120 [Tulasnella sp. 331]|nr:hypothetical protein FRB97_009120 [Tulasnella sp. 331]KAG8887780.1 hypothetical protein FRB98_009040 [Tulasnella sp. 332]